jgi:gamma-glutamyl hercynylcysteine S-oxide synthase
MTTLDFTLELSHKAMSNFDASTSMHASTSLIARGIAARSFLKADIERELIRLRQWLIAWIESLPEVALRPPVVATINPPLWEACHVAWFAEWWCVRDAYNVDDGTSLGATKADRDSMWCDGDAFLNSNAIAHDARWALPQITRAATLDYLKRSLDATITRLRAADESDGALYRFRLAMFHEAMHLEALAWCSQTLAWSRPAWVAVRSTKSEATRNPGNSRARPIQLGKNADSIHFRFDNEIDYTPCVNGHLPVLSELISNENFLAFVESSDYQKLASRSHPLYWRRDASGAWQQRCFDQWVALNLDEPVVHVNANEAEAFALWADARLPNEDELHAFFGGENAAEDWHGAVWEWTSSVFAPPNNFKPGLYREYSAPWFDGKHRVLRGGSFATLDIIHHPHYRNFFTPERADVFAGFRTCRK